eukprot:6575303-Pyramimonas_sp.AAC.1
MGCPGPRAGGAWQTGSPTNAAAAGRPKESGSLPGNGMMARPGVTPALGPGAVRPLSGLS